MASPVPEQGRLTPSAFLAEQTSRRAFSSPPSCSSLVVLIPLWVCPIWWQLAPGFQVASRQEEQTDPRRSHIQHCHSILFSGKPTNSPTTGTCRDALGGVFQIHHLRDSLQKDQAVPFSCYTQATPSPSVGPTETTGYTGFKSHPLQLKTLLAENFGISSLKPTSHLLQQEIRETISICRTFLTFKCKQSSKPN